MRGGRKIWPGTVGAAIGALALVHSRAWAFLCDDAFISFRYARHLAEHGTLAYNLAAPRELVEGYTNFLWVLLLALGDRLGAAPEQLAPWLTQADLSGLRAAMAGCLVSGAVGPVACVRQVLAALGLDGLPARLDRDEPGFALDLAALRMPDAAGAVLVPASDAWRDVLVAWRAAYHGDVLGTVGRQAQDRAAEEIAGYIAEGSHRVLLRDGQPVAMTGFNARLAEIVQVGGVYTPPALRGRGHAKAAVALHLAEARDAGAARAVLFAASEAAARAYLGIGFQPSLEFALVLLTDPATVPPCR